MIRVEDPLQLYLVRHAEAHKNLANIHGGGDQRLTPRGVGQAGRLGNFLRQHGDFQPHTGIVVHQPEGRSAKTAYIIGSVVVAKVHLEPTLRGISMGIIAGLPEKELEDLYPEVASEIRAWRASGGASSHPEIPGSESMTNFADRVRTGLKCSLAGALGRQAMAIIATTSTLTMLNHLLVNDGSLRQDSYVFTDPPLGSVATWHISSEPPAQLQPSITPT